MSDSPTPEISFDDFQKIDIRVGTIVRTEEFPAARKPAYVLHIDFGPDGLVGRQVAAVVNFPPRQIGPHMSEVLTLGFPDGDGEVVMIGVDHEVPNGGRLY